MSGKTHAGSLQQQLSGCWTVHSLYFESRPDLYYDLSLVLEKSGDRVRVIFRDVSNLRIDDFGGGLTQLRGLKIDDISARQWDRARYSITELEDEKHFACNCFNVTVET